MEQTVYIHQWRSISALGTNTDEIWQNYLNPKAFLSPRKNDQVVEGRITEIPQNWEKIWAEKNFQNLDKVVKMALGLASEITRADQAMVTFGSSRGATELWENRHESFIESPEKLHPKTSPDTTLGSISSWVAQYLNLQNAAVDLSMTCSSGLLALANGVAWLKAKMTTDALVGASEMCLTDFSIQQLKNMKAYSKLSQDSYPCRALDLQKEQNTLVLGEAAALGHLSLSPSETTLGKIIGLATTVEPIRHATDLSMEGKGIEQTMRKALEDASLSSDEIDVVITHTPGTKKGDLAEMFAVEKVFGKKLPSITTNKWKIGHTYGSSALMSVELALLMLQNQQFIPSPFYPTDTPKQINKVLVNAMGFGGICGTVILRR